MLIPKVKTKEFEKWGFKKCKGEYGKNIEDVGTMYHEGDHVCYNRIYYTAGDWTDGATPYYTDGVITHVYKGTRHPYLIGDGTGFVDDELIDTQWDVNI